MWINSSEKGKNKYTAFQEVLDKKLDVFLRLLKVSKLRNLLLILFDTKPKWPW